MATSVIRRLIWFFVDVGLKFAIGVTITTIIWLPFRFLNGSAFYPWAIAGLILGALLNGLWELSDVFGTKKWFGIED